VVLPDEPSTSAGSAVSAAPDESAGPAPSRPLGRRSSLTTRAIALAVVLLILTISYASSLRIYFAQAEKIAATRTEIAERSEAITELRGKLSQWDDPAYVRLQARERLGWVVPGEIGFRVIGPDGKPLGGGAQINEPRAALSGEEDAWWLRLRRSLEAADRPAPASGSAAAERTPITDKTTPTPSASPR
jgi:cell division protein FtsB